MISGGSNRTGAWAYHEATTSVTLNSGQHLYAPTLQAPYYCPLQPMSRYWEVNKRGFSVWDWTVGGEDKFTVWEPFTSSWQDKYVRNYIGVPCYETKIIKDSGTWYVYLHNYNTKTWDYKWGAEGSSSYYDGWDIWEEWYMYPNWPTLPKINCQEIYVQTDGFHWHLVDESWGYENDAAGEGFPPHGFDERFYDWWVGPKN